ncbi:MAG: SirA family protein [Dehalococcoidia bacterium]|nr:MAG: SirA family protein [Dehalococcoidia bacterium]
MVEIDVRGFSCPIPVIRAKKAIEEKPKEVITVLVDNAAAKENVSRLAKSEGYSVEIEEVGENFCLRLSPPKNR